MLESKGNRTDLSNLRNNRLRKAWDKLLRSFRVNADKIPRGLQGMGSTRVSGGVDEKVLPNFQSPDTINMKEVTQELTREEKFAKHKFEWVKTERAGDICTFSHFVEEGGIEYACFMDNTRIRMDLIGDVVLMHAFSNEILGAELKLQASVAEPQQVIEPQKVESKESSAVPSLPRVKIEDPVVSILERTKKRTEKLNLVLSVKIPAPELYAVVKENFENVEEILIENVMEQIQENVLREAIKRELQNIYAKKKKS